MSEERAERSALVVVDMLNPYGHEDAARLTESVERIVEPVTALIARAPSWPTRLSR